MNRDKLPMNQAPRCRARTRAGKPCQSPAVRPRGRVRVRGPALSLADGDCRAYHRSALVGPALLWADPASACFGRRRWPMTRPAANGTRRSGAVRCAIYTRKSSTAWVCPRHCRTRVVPVFGTIPGSNDEVPLANSLAMVCRRRRSAALGPPCAHSCSSLARARIIRSRLRPKGGPLRCNLRQPSRRSCVDRLGNPAISPSACAASGFPGRLFRSPSRRGTGDGSPECWRAEVSWVGGVIRLPARRRGRPGRVPLWPKRG